LAFQTDIIWNSFFLTKLPFFAFGAKSALALALADGSAIVRIKDSTANITLGDHGFLSRRQHASRKQRNSFVVRKRVEKAGDFISQCQPTLVFNGVCAVTTNQNARLARPQQPSLFVNSHNIVALLVVAVDFKPHGYSFAKLDPTNPWWWRLPNKKSGGNSPS
jgi:hypothetical protein